MIASSGPSRSAGIGMLALSGILMVILLAWPDVSRAQSYAIGNDQVRRTVLVEDGALAGSILENRQTGATLHARGDEFAMTAVTPEVRITPLPSNVIRLDPSNTVIDSVHHAADVLTLYLRSERAPFSFELSYAADAEHPVIHKSFRWRQSSDAEEIPWFVEELWLEDLALETADARGGGYGQPVFTDDLFWGIEYPASVADAANGRLRLSYDVGTNATADWQKSYPAVLGAGERGTVRHDFIRYVNALRPNPVEPYLLYNSWYDIRDFNYPEFFDRLDFFADFASRYGEDLDAFVLDDGWDDLEGSLWDVDRNKLPQELTPVGDRLREMGSALGLWISPWGGYDTALRRRAQLAREQGYEHMGNYLDLGGPRYFDHFRSTMLDYQQRFNIGFWKIDGFLSTSNRPDNGHLIGRFSRRVLMDRFLDVMDTLREDRPDVRLQITVGTWQSPWWLLWADYIWMGGEDYAFSEDVPSITRRDQSLTYRDQVMYDGVVTEGYVMPGSAFMTHGIIKGRLNMLGGEDETPEAFLKDAVMYFSRGVSMWELYLTPDRVSEAEWEGLVQIWRWARDNWEALQHTVYVGGAPRRGEVYGYAHFDGTRGLLTLRNPSSEAQTFSMMLDRGIGKIDTTAVWHALRSFPQQAGLRSAISYGNAFEVQVDPYEVAVFEFVTSNDLPDAFAVGVPYRVVSNAAGTHLEMLVTSADTYRVQVAEGVEASGEVTREGGTAVPQASARGFTWHSEPRDVVGRVGLELDPTLREPELIVLLRADNDAAPVLVDDRGDVVPGRQDGDGRWWWFEVPVEEGRSEVTLRLREATDFGGTAQLFLTARPERDVVRIPLSGTVRIPEATLPFEWDQERKTYQLTEPVRIQ
jgi:hypothetical protein